MIFNCEVVCGRFHEGEWNSTTGMCSSLSGRMEDFEYSLFDQVSFTVTLANMWDQGNYKLQIEYGGLTDQSSINLKVHSKYIFKNNTEKIRKCDTYLYFVKANLK